LLKTDKPAENNLADENSVTQGPRAKPTPNFAAIAPENRFETIATGPPSKSTVNLL